MAELTVHTTEHVIEVDAEPARVYPVIADVSRWPYTFEPTVHVDRLEAVGNTERLRIWATANGAVRSWTSRRDLDPGAGRILFRQEVSAPPVTSMGGEWRLEALPGDRTRVVLLHDFTVDGDEESVSWVRRAIDGNSGKELAAVRSAAESPADGTLLSFTDSVAIAASAERVYDFLYRADLWTERLPHVTRIELTEEQPGVQSLEMDTRAPDGDLHTTRSVRVCFASDRIAYKQFVVPPLMAAHTGVWTVAEAPGGVLATSQHTVVIRAERVTELLGTDATLDDARALVRRSLGANSTRTLEIARRELAPLPIAD